ncbi:hypothetical protein PsorP6_000382 [Peronosclerospora sorghi]|uniref:Uncharacterized protein n=1 Tax=Peronosclerospora sorghi TaxID=230839 RepID=A0ACC0WSP8_9STRA|nr:hypothetical protein PsorP6_000382 [Peronosclerospora sorghi]
MNRVPVAVALFHATVIRNLLHCSYVAIHFLTKLFLFNRAKIIGRLEELVGRASARDPRMCQCLLCGESIGRIHLCQIIMSITYRTTATEQHVYDDSQRPHVYGHGVCLTLQHLRSKVTSCSQERGRFVICIQQFCKTKIDDFNLRSERFARQH